MFNFLKKIPKKLTVVKDKSDTEYEKKENERLLDFYFPDRNLYMNRYNVSSDTDYIDFEEIKE